MTRALTKDQIRKLHETVARLKAAHVVAARRSSAAFTSYVMRDESGQQLKLADFHHEWHKLLALHEQLIIWGSAEIGKCEAAGARIALADGRHERIERLCGQRVRIQLLDPHGMNLRTADAAVSDNGLRRVHHIRLKSGRRLTLTDEHPLYTPSGWRKARELRVGGFVAAARQGAEPAEPGALTGDEAELLGIRASGKGVPEEVFQASNEAVKRFLAGYLVFDVDLHEKHLFGRTAPSEEAALDVQLLLLRFGIASVVQGRRLTSLPRNSEPVFWDEIVEVSTEENVQTYAVAVFDSAHCYLSSGVISHNTIQLISYVAWKIGMDPSIRVVIASKTKEKAAQILGAIVNVMSSAAYREVFPHVVIIGSNAHTLRVLGYDGKNPTVQAYQFKAPIVGNRVDLLIFDDILDRSNTRNEQTRDEWHQFYKDTYISRLTRRGQVVFISNAWHPRDLMHRLQEEGGWVTKRYPIWTEVDGKMVPLWPEQWPVERILKVREKFGKDRVFWDRNYECVALDDASVTWKREWVDEAERCGLGLPWPINLSAAHGETFRQIVIGVDLATKRPSSRRKTDESILCVVGQLHNGRKRLLHIRSGRWHGPEIVSEIREMRRRFHPAIPWVESNAAQIYIVDYCKEPGKQSQSSGWIGMEGLEDLLPQQSNEDPIPVRSFDTTAQNKYDSRFGVEALGTELSCGIWLFPNVPGVEQPAEYLKLIDEMMAYDPTGHVGDRLMAMWIANEGLRLGGGSIEVVPGANARGR